ncbi:hypothetical protein ACKKBG_A20445 [Auxenochlorella protothecoides x Auxenochlorella symbiontica]
MDGPPRCTPRISHPAFHRLLASTDFREAAVAQFTLQDVIEDAEERGGVVLPPARMLDKLTEVFHGAGVDVGGTATSSWTVTAKVELQQGLSQSVRLPPQALSTSVAADRVPEFAFDLLAPLLQRGASQDQLTDEELEQAVESEMSQVLRHIQSATGSEGLLEELHYIDNDMSPPKKLRMDASASEPCSPKGPDSRGCTEALFSEEASVPSTQSQPVDQKLAVEGHLSPSQDHTKPRVVARHSRRQRMHGAGPKATIIRQPQ